MPRSRLGPLAIETKLGDHPSTSSVWRAVHVQLQKAVAVKVFSAPFGGTPEARRSFAEEWEKLKLLSHPGIAKCFGGGFEETDAYLAYELIEGETLSIQLERSGRLSWENVLDVAEGLADALEYLHQQNVVHGAIVPEKIVVTGFVPVLLDLRINRFDSPFRTSRPPTLEQTARHAPELLTTNGAGSTVSANQSADLYNLGALLYQLVTGRLPISGDTIQQVRENAHKEIPESPASIVLQCPIWLDKLIMQLLEKDPANRPPSATAVKMALAEVRKRALSRTGVAEHVSSGFSPLQVTNQRDKDEARTLLGRGVVDLDAQEEEESREAIVWHDQPWILLGGLVLLLLLLAYVAWPASEATLRARAERLLRVGTRSALAEAEAKPLREILVRFPDGPNALWAKEQIDFINVKQFLHQLSIKIKRDLPIKDQGELLHKQAQEYAAEGDIAEAIEKYESMITVLGSDPEFETAVNAASFQLELLRRGDVKSDASMIVQQRLDEADRLYASGNEEEARQIWSGLVELYGDNKQLAPLIQMAQSKLQQKN